MQIASHLGLCETYVSQSSVGLWRSMESLHSSLAQGEGEEWASSFSRQITEDVDRFTGSSSLPESTRRNVAHQVAYHAVDYISRRAEGAHGALAATAYYPACGGPDPGMGKVLNGALQEVAENSQRAPLPTLLAKNVLAWAEHISSPQLKARVHEEASRYLIHQPDPRAAAVGLATWNHLGFRPFKPDQASAQARVVFQALQERQAPSSQPASAVQDELSRVAQGSPGPGQALARAVVNVTNSRNPFPPLTQATADKVQQMALTMSSNAGPLGPALLAVTRFGMEACQPNDDFRRFARELLATSGTDFTPAQQTLAGVLNSNYLDVMSEGAARQMVSDLVSRLSQAGDSPVKAAAELGLASLDQNWSDADRRLAGRAVLNGLKLREPEQPCFITRWLEDPSETLRRETQTEQARLAARADDQSMGYREHAEVVADLKSAFQALAQG